MPLVIKSPRASISLPQTLEEYLLNPPQGMEWVDYHLVEKTGMTLKHSRIQSQISRLWGNYIDSTKMGGVVYVEAPCRTLLQGRRPDVGLASLTICSKHSWCYPDLRSFSKIY